MGRVGSDVDLGWGRDWGRQEKSKTHHHLDFLNLQRECVGRDDDGER